METDRRDMDNQNQQKGGSKAYDAQAKPWTQKPGSDGSPQRDAGQRDAKADQDKEHTSEDRQSDAKSFAKRDDQRTSENSKN